MKGYEEDRWINGLKYINRRKLAHNILVSWKVMTKKKSKRNEIIRKQKMNHA